MPHGLVRPILQFHPLPPPLLPHHRRHRRLRRDLLPPDVSDNHRSLTYKVPVDKEEIYDIPHHRWRLDTLFLRLGRNEISPETSWFFDVSKCRVQDGGPIKRDMGERGGSPRLGPMVMLPLVQVMSVISIP